MRGFGGCRCSTHAATEDDSHHIAAHNETDVLWVFGGCCSADEGSGSHSRRMATSDSELSFEFINTSTSLDLNYFFVERIQIILLVFNTQMIKKKCL